MHIPNVDIHLYECRDGHYRARLTWSSSRDGVLTEHCAISPSRFFLKDVLVEVHHAIVTLSNELPLASTWEIKR